MLDCTELSQSKTYTIRGQKGIWHFSHREEGLRSLRYVFWRFGAKEPNRRVSLSLGHDQTKRDVWEKQTQPQIIDLSKLEAFNGF